MNKLYTWFTILITTIITFGFISREQYLEAIAFLWCIFLIISLSKTLTLLNAQNYAGLEAIKESFIDTQNIIADILRGNKELIDSMLYTVKRFDDYLDDQESK